MNNIGEHKELKNFDLNILKRILVEKRKFGDHVHGQRKELIGVRGGMAIKIIWEKDKASSKNFQRKLKLTMLRV